MGNSFIRKIVGWELGLIGYQIIRNKKEPLTEEDKKRLVDNTFIQKELRLEEGQQKKHIPETTEYKNEVKSGKEKTTIILKDNATDQDRLSFCRRLLRRADKKITVLSRGKKWEGRFIFKINEYIYCKNDMYTNCFVVITRANGGAHIFPIRGK